MHLENEASENDKEDRSLIKEMNFNSNSFQIRIDTFARCFMSNKLNKFAMCQLCHAKQKVKIKVADGDKIETKRVGNVT